MDFPREPWSVKSYLFFGVKHPNFSVASVNTSATHIQRKISISSPSLNIRILQNEGSSSVRSVNDKAWGLEIERIERHEERHKKSRSKDPWLLSFTQRTFVSLRKKFQFHPKFETCQHSNYGLMSIQLDANELAVTEKGESHVRCF